ncbi:MAG: biosis protein MshK [Pseudomonadota bacterium]|nr:biosis protein MshK [Pseudomonadota bacterium]
MVNSQRLAIISIGLLGLPWRIGAATDSEVRDPTQPPAGILSANRAGAVTPTASATADAFPSRQGLSLQMTMIAGDKRSAFINGRLIDEGQTIGEARVVSITHGQALLQDAQGEFRLYMNYMPPNTRGSLRDPPGTTGNPPEAIEKSR